MECGCKVVAQARIDTLVLMRTKQSRKMQQTGTWAHEVARAMEEQLREDKQELKTWDQKKKSKDAKRMRGIVHENDKKTKEQSRAR